MQASETEIEKKCWLEIIKQHQLKYPLMQPADWVKLAYQHVFAGGHLIDDPEQSLQLLKNELAAIKTISRNGRGQKTSETEFSADQNRLKHTLSLDQYSCESVSAEFDKNCFMTKKTAECDPMLKLRSEMIGQELVRVSLRDLPENDQAVNTLNDLFVCTANQIKGSHAQLRDRLAWLLEASREGIISISAAKINAYINAYQNKGCPAVHHSETYRRSYHPAYRLIKKIHADFFGLFVSINQLLSQKETSLIALDGSSGCGKSYLSEAVKTVYGDKLQIIHMDDFFLQQHQRTNERLAQPGGNIDYERFEQAIIKPYLQGTLSSYQKFDCRTMSLGKQVELPPARIYLVEGVYSQHPVFSTYYDLKVFLKIDTNQQLERIRQRSGEILLAKFIETWIPMENTYFSAFDIEKKADLSYEV